MKESAHKISHMPPIDFERLRMIVDTAEEERAIMTVFFEQAEEILASMEKFAPNTTSLDWDHAAHNLGGAAANLGMDYLVKKCGQAERNPELTLLQRNVLLQEIKEEVKHIRNYVSHMLI